MPDYEDSDITNFNVRLRNDIFGSSIHSNFSAIKEIIDNSKDNKATKICTELITPNMDPKNTGPRSLSRYLCPEMLTKPIVAMSDNGTGIEHFRNLLDTGSHK